MNKINNILKSTNIFSKNINNIYKPTCNFITFNNSNYYKNKNHNQKKDFKFKFYNNNNNNHHQKGNQSYFNQYTIDFISSFYVYYSTDSEENTKKSNSFSAIKSICFFNKAISANQSVINMKKSSIISNQVKNTFSTIVASKSSFFKIIEINI